MILLLVRPDTNLKEEKNNAYGKFHKRNVYPERYTKYLNNISVSERGKNVKEMGVYTPFS